jgi:hypothetical protein
MSHTAAVAANRFRLTIFLFLSEGDILGIKEGPPISHTAVISCSNLLNYQALNSGGTVQVLFAVDIVPAQLQSLR